MSELFKKTRHSIADKVSKGIMSYDMNRVTTVETDWSKDGISFCCAKNTVTARN